jgi:hypothetical protein
MLDNVIYEAPADQTAENLSIHPPKPIHEKLYGR